MILERLYIENYKQFREPVDLSPPEGAIGVVGSNGAGKSTLFESILWAFFGSRPRDPRFTNESIPWSGGSTKEPSVVEVTLALGGQSYTVRRQLKSNQTTAEARDGSGETIVTGTTDVTKWVEQQLLRMDRTAFEATFFARQKELKFFAQDSGIERVRKISKMLGISHVEDAQKFLREDRNELRTEARLMESRLAETDAEALEKELEDARAKCHRVEEELERVSGDLEAATAGLEAARKARAALDPARREHVRLTGELGKAEGEGSRAEDRAKEAERDLEEIRKAGEELEKIKPEVSRLPELESELERLEEARRKDEQRARARQELLKSRTRIAKIEGELSDTLDGLDGSGEEPLDGWNALFDLEGAEQLEATRALLERAGGELEHAESHLEYLGEMERLHAEARQAEEAAGEARKRLEAARKEQAGVEEELEALSGGEDLEARERELREEADKLRELAAAKRGSAASNEKEARNIDRAREAIESGAEDHCPTCRREFEDEEYEETLDTLRRQAAALRRGAAKYNEEVEKLAASADSTAEKAESVSGRLSKWRALREKLVRAEAAAEDRREALESARSHHRDLTSHLDGSTPPTQEAVEKARSHRSTLRGLRDALPAVRSQTREHSELEERIEELKEELEELSGVSYDAEEHREKQRNHSRLNTLQGRAGELERAVGRRPEIEKALEEARSRVREASESAEKLRVEISGLGFDEEEYEAAGERVTRAEEKAARLRDERERLGGEWKDADYETDRVSKELKRLEAERKQAKTKAAEAARMDEMDGLFTEFSRSLTARARPMLEAEASGLVRELTDGRYDRMEFDDNYRVNLLDRFDDSYAIERFSGGEGDVASLSARVGLSRIIAAAGSETLGFLVLDEVFGSLDAERRNNVLHALERLKRSFGQIFIISHVGEVQESALIDELWTVEEDEDGRSAVHRAGQSSEKFAEISDSSNL